MKFNSADIAPVTWTQDIMHYELRCQDPHLICRANSILQYWNVPTLSSPEILAMHAGPTGAAWQFLGSQPGTTGIYQDIPSVIRAAETDAALAVVNRPDQFLTVHGALMARGDDAVLIVGPPHSGKSTTACALWAAGWQLLSDDLTILHSAPYAGYASPVLRRVSIRHPSKSLLGLSLWERITALESCDKTADGYVFHPDELNPALPSRARGAAIRAVIFLQRQNIAPPPPAVLRTITPVQALLALASYTNVIRHLGLGECMGRLGGLLNSVPSYDLGRGALSSMIETLDKLITSESNAPCGRPKRQGGDETGRDACPTAMLRDINGEQGSHDD